MCGERGIVARLGGDTRFLSRITAIGLTPGCPVEILRSEKRQPVLLYSRDTMIALSRGEGEKIMLEVHARATNTAKTQNSRKPGAGA